MLFQTRFDAFGILFWYYHYPYYFTICRKVVIIIMHVGHGWHSHGFLLLKRKVGFALSPNAQFRFCRCWGSWRGFKRYLCNQIRLNLLLIPYVILIFSEKDTCTTHNTTTNNKCSSLGQPTLVSRTPRAKGKNIQSNVH